MPARQRAMRGLAALGLLVFALLFGFAAVAVQPTEAREPVTVFAAASLKESLDQAAAAFQRQTGQPILVSYAASSALARQIEQAAPADVFISADLEWMDWLQQRRLIDAASRRNLLGNTLVLVAPRNAPVKRLQLIRGVRLAPLLGDGRIAMALTQSVPAGKYAKASLQWLGIWSTLRAHAAEAENVRAALMLVARGEAPLGVVYGSDAQAEPGVKVLGTFPAQSHPPIVYPVARLRASRHPQASVFVRWLESPAADALFRRHGFSTR